MKNSVRTTLVATLIIVFASITLFFALSKIQEKPKGNRDQIIPVVGLATIEEGKIVLRGQNLSRVEVWAVVQKDEKGESRVYWGDAKYTETGVETMESNRWIFSIPTQKVSVKGIFFRVYGKNDEKLDDVPFPYANEKALNEALWPNNTATTSSATTQSPAPNTLNKPNAPLISGKVTVGLNQKAILLNNVTLEVATVLSDSRCPVEVQCVWSGKVDILVYLRQEDELQKTVLSTAGTSTIQFEGSNIHLEDVTPYPKTASRSIEQKDYRFTFSVTRHNL